MFKSKKQKRSNSGSYLVIRNGYKGLQSEKRAARIIKHSGAF